VIVPDASVVVNALLDSGRDGALAREVMMESAERHAPHLLDVEVTSVLRRWVNAGRLTPDVATSTIADLRDLDVIRHDHALLLEQAITLRNTVSAYDAMYVALADLIGADLVTADGPLSRGAAAHCRIRFLGAPTS
jgi:predicted nucleic acid-binding protein